MKKKHIIILGTRNYFFQAFLLFISWEEGMISEKELIMLKRITAGIDGSSNSLQAAQAGIKIARKTGADVHFVFVADSRNTAMPYIYTNGNMAAPFTQVMMPADINLREVFKKISQDLHEFGKKQLDVCRKLCENSGIGFSGIVREGFPAEILAEEARSGGLLIAGKRGENAGIKKITIGSTAEELLYISPRPLLICPDAECSFDSLLFPYDGSRSSENALQYLANMIKDLPAETTMAIIDEQQCEEEEIKEEISYLHSHNINAKLIREAGNPAKTVCRLTRDGGYDFILMGSRGRKKLADFVMGSTTIHLVRKCSLPILVAY